MKSNSDASSRKAPRGNAEARASEVPNLSRLVEVDNIPDAGLDISVRADAAERAAIAKANGLVAVESLEADLDVVKESAKKFRITGPLRARIVQACVVSLEPFESEIEAQVEADFQNFVEKAAPRARSARRAEAEAEPEPSFAAQLDAPDPVVNGRIDVGALVEEFLVLSLDPYPRKPGVQFEGAECPGAPDEPASPFAVLKKLRD
ncbi:YceD family protein [Methylocella tundrae]|uniref:DUF177 domain-containing protein n=1 Tax=Methylocella tundrae TaxID=227605 RepID=A0A4U8YY13_METTU|nr:YceD family protein [Methylocella tundrae]WPP05759.1 YceD family protein [Methylocella tundrae]VFU08255.1 conserved protein of unknown function [Methylocella tundrae]